MHASRISMLAAGIVLAAAAATSAQPLATRVLVPAPTAFTAIGGITVQGRGTVRRPADLARFAINVGNRAQPTAAIAGADLLIAALKNAGVADAALANPAAAFLSQQQFLTVVGSLRKPTLDAVRSLLAAVSANVPATLAIENVNVTLYLDDCRVAENAAIVAAQHDARGRAEQIAAAAHVSLGGVVAVNEQGPPTPPCPTKPDAVTTQFSGQVPDFSTLTGSLDVPVTVFQTVTFAIR